jgi:hypothetical protein
VQQSCLWLLELIQVQARVQELALVLAAVS